MKKILFFLFLITFSKCYSQTEKETIDWITSKIEKYGDVYVNSSFALNVQQTVISVDSYSGSITLKQVRFFDASKPLPTEVYTLNLKDINGWGTAKGFNDEPKFLPIATKGQQIKVTIDDKTTMKSTMVLVLDWKAEENLQSRFIKALEKLISFNKDRYKTEVF